MMKLNICHKKSYALQWIQFNRSKIKYFYVTNKALLNMKINIAINLKRYYKQQALTA